MSAAEPAFRGSLADTPVPQLLRRIFVEQWKGSLTISHGEETRRFLFEKGELRTASSSREGQKIGSFLRRRGRITDEDLKRALEEASRGGDSVLGKALVQRGVLPQAVLDAEIKRLVEEIVLSTFEWDSGDYRLDPSAEPPGPDVALSLSTAAVIVEGIRRLPEGPVFRERLGDGSGILRLARDPMSRYQYLPLTPQEAYVLSRIDGQLPLDALLAVAGGPRPAAAKMIYALLSCGLVEWKEEAGGRRDTSGSIATLNVEVASEPPHRADKHPDIVRNTYRRIDWLTHYELLGIGQDADAEQIRKAYLERSRLFHPDLRHREDLAALEKELAAVFERLKAAHDVLADPAARAQYDASLDATTSVVFAQETAADPDAGSQLAALNYERAKELIAAKDYYPAIEMLREAVRFAPDKAEYFFELGQAELRNVHWADEGLEHLKESTRLEPERVEFLRETAKALAAHGRQHEAETFTRRAREAEASAKSVTPPDEKGRHPRPGATPVKSPATEPSKGKSGLFSRMIGKKN